MDLMLGNLNDAQRAAVETTDGPLLVLSGAGTGKTRVLTTRVAYILQTGLAAPWQILALTFTNRAANEMKNRIAAFADNKFDVRDLWCGTFHSMALRILHANAAAAGLRPDFVIYGEEDQKGVLKNIIASIGGATKTPSDYIEQISSIKDKGLSALDCRDAVYRAYNDELARVGAVDFGDIILRVLQLFATHPEILEKYRRQFKYIMVDEFQDTNHAQMEFLEMLTRGVEMPNICCVGDDDQSIYSWRGAEIKHILNFDKTYAGSRIIRLETNYRSTPNILGAANSLIRHNKGRLGKDLRPADAASVGEPVYVLTVLTDWDEARIIADAIERVPSPEYSDFAVLIRAGSLSRLFEEEFTRRGIPYRLIGATKFYDRMEIRDAIAYIRLMTSPFDVMAFTRAMGRPKRGFGPAAIERVRAAAGAGGDLIAALRSAKLTAKQRTAADEFLSAYDFDWANMSPADAAQTVLEKSGYMQMWRESKDVDARDRLENIRELITNVIAKYDTLSEFLEQAALMTTDDDADSVITAGAVSIMTIHAAKGLEFDTVFLPAWEDGIFPNDKTMNEGALEEERRLGYVAITRARRRAIIINTMSRRVFGEQKYNSPSRFITEMDGRFLDFQGGDVRQSYAPRRTIPTSYSSRPAQNAAPRAANTNMVGRLVSHAEMGRGVVLESDGDIVTVAFKNRGIKKVARQYLTLE